MAPAVEGREQESEWAGVRRRRRSSAAGTRAARHAGTSNLARSQPASITLERSKAWVGQTGLCRSCSLAVASLSGSKHDSSVWLTSAKPRALSGLDGYDWPWGGSSASEGRPGSVNCFGSARDGIRD